MNWIEKNRETLWEIAYAITALGILLILANYIIGVLVSQTNALEAPCIGYTPPNQTYNASHVYFWDNTTKQCIYQNMTNLVPFT